MARIRTIKPQHCSDKNLPMISLQAHLFWILSWCFSDDEGVIENDPLLLKSQIFPRRTDIRTEQVDQWIDQLIKARYIIPFTHKGESYLLHRTFNIHQKIDRPQPSKIPSEIIRGLIDEYSTNDHPCIVEERNVKEKDITPKGVDESPPADSPPDIQGLYKKLKKGKREISEFISQYKPDFIDPYIDLWNLFASEKKLAKVSKLTDSRKRKFKVRIAEKGFDFLSILKKAKTSEFLLTGKWFGFDWLFENDSNYLKVIEGNYDKKEEPAQISKSPEIKTLAKIEIEINYLYERFVEDESKVTIISTDPVQYNHLKQAGFIQFTDELSKSIHEQAVSQLNGHADEAKLLAMKKKIGVLEFFKQQKSKGEQSIFWLE